MTIWWNSSFLYGLSVTLPPLACLAQLVHWTKRWSPFDYDFIVIPVHHVNHWFSCIVIGANDSLPSPSTSPFLSNHRFVIVRGLTLSDQAAGLSTSYPWTLWKAIAHLPDL
ncbi:hypothetical protein M422DRAFT_25939 [Sphaerobolus stellatus SS14]|nr:hypothetical protein M422DRAFT_25939 [Sphaerobolus stellatus SS14]